MILKIIFLASILINSNIDSNVIWGKIGHRVVGKIAETVITEKTKDEINKILDGESIAMVSTWADEKRSDPKFDKYGIWHYVNMPLDKSYSEANHTQENIVTVIKKSTELLKSNSLSKEEKKFYLKFLIHLVGDIHQPLHVGRAEDRGGNDIKVNFFDKKSNLHSVWDSDMINNYRISFTEFSNHLININDSDKNFIIGDAEVWANESQDFVKEIYSKVKNGDRLGYEYIYLNFPIVKQRLYQGGIRLGHLLNEIFDN